MDTGEVVAIIVVVFVLLIGSVIIGVRCCRSACQLIRDASSNTKFSVAVRDGKIILASELVLCHSAA